MESFERENIHRKTELELVLVGLRDGFCFWKVRYWKELVSGMIDRDSSAEESLWHNIFHEQDENGVP